LLAPVWVPDAAHEALRDLVRARAAAKEDESRAKHRLVKYLLRNGLRHPEQARAWTHAWWRWVQELKFEHEAQRETMADWIAEVLHMGARVSRLELAIDRAIEAAPPEKKAAVEALQALRGVAKVTAVTIVTEVGTFRRRRCAADDQHVTFRYRDSRDGQNKAMTLPVGGFLRRFLQHVPPKGFHRVRAFGLLHPEHRDRLRQLQLLFAPRKSSVHAHTSIHGERESAKRLDKGCHRESWRTDEPSAPRPDSPIRLASNPGRLSVVSAP
jgi:hypothetical protein